MGRANKFSNYPNGFAGGVTILNAPVSIQAGNIFWVSSTDAHASNTTGHGTYDKPFATIDYAIGRCTANHGDEIHVKANHAETISAAAGIDADVEGISIIGHGNGDDRPTISFTAALSDIDIDADNVTIDNMIFLADFATGVTATIDVNKEFFTLRNCLFIGNGATKPHKISIITDANANDMTVENCEFQLLVAEDGATAITTTSTEAIRLVGADRARILGNYFSGDFTTSAINGITTASKDIRIVGNVVNNTATENIAGGIDLVNSCTGWVGDNYVYVDYASSNVALIDASSCVLGRNWVSNEAGELPVLHGTLEAGDVEYQVSQAVSEIGSLYTAMSTKQSVLDSKLDSVGTVAGA